MAQQALSLGLTQLVLSVAMRTMPAEPLEVWWWPLVASGTAVAPVAASVLAAIAAYAADTAVRLYLRPRRRRSGSFGGETRGEEEEGG